MQIDTTAFYQMMEDIIPLNKFLGLKIETFDTESARLVTRLDMRPEYIGNAVRNMPHGGILSFLIDATAGGAAALSVNNAELLDKLSTIDMRVDYLKPAKGNILYATSEVMRSGNRVIVVRTDVHDNEGILTALGSNVFNISR